MRFVGAVLMLFGAVALGYQGFTYGARTAAVGSARSEDRERSVWAAPVVGGAAAVAGFALLAAGGRRSGSDPPGRAGSV
ncbi:MAG: hypothetical protein C0501_17105 [Isosphaera sp.]|nr:hypothetical protein [Isosphaera sp.]